MKKYELDILHLYPKEMNLYGDHGNVLVLKKRCEWRDINVNIITHQVGGKFPENADIIFGGGGQDSGQKSIHVDLIHNKKQIHELIDRGVPCLVVCGLYQLFGHSFQPFRGETLEGISIFDAKTIGENERLIGNIVTESKIFGTIIGYENHSGKTYLKSIDQHLSKVIRGAGNNGSDRTEGAMVKNAIGSYLHGPILPNNPRIADFMIKKALENKYGEKIELQSLDDSLSNLIHQASQTRSR